MKKVNVLVIENSEEFSNWIVINLRKNKDLNVYGNVKTKKLGLEKLRELQPDVIILDLELDDGSGFEIIKEIKYKSLPIKIIVFSNHYIFREQCLKMECDFFFDKSNEFEEMINSVHDLIKIEQ